MDKRKLIPRCKRCGCLIGKNEHNCSKTKQRQSEAKLKNPTRYWLGKHRSLELHEKLRLANLNRKHPKGPDSPNWKGGDRDWWGRDARKTMEKHIGRKLTRKDIMHHLNGNWKDNRIENLLLTNRKDHAKLHSPKGSKFGINKLKGRYNGETS